MTNNQCYCYSVKAISNIIKAKGILRPDTFYIELQSLWDVYGEKAIEEVVRREEYLDEIKFEIQ